MNSNSISGELNLQPTSDPNRLSESSQKETSNFKEAPGVQGGTFSNYATPNILHATSSNIPRQNTSSAFSQSSTAPTTSQDMKNSLHDRKEATQDAETQLPSPLPETQANLTKAQKEMQKPEEAKISDVEKRIHFIINCPIYFPKDNQHIHEKINKIIEKIEKEGFRKDHEYLLEHVYFVFGLNRCSDDRVDFKINGQITKNSEMSVTGLYFTWPLRPKKTNKSNENGENSCNENEKTQIPMQEIRQIILQSQQTTDYWKEISKKPNSIIYLMCIDDDTEDFNGVFSSYIDCVTKALREGDEPPAVMTTGYEFLEKIEDKQQRMAWFASRLDRIVRVATCKVIPWGAYFPEPNLCLYVNKSYSPYQNFILNETFCEKYVNNWGENKPGDFKWPDQCKRESPFILKQVFNSIVRKKRKFIFLDKPPLITATPSDVTKMLNDQKAIKKVRQNHFCPRNWSFGLFYNWKPTSIQKEDYIRGQLQTFFSKLDAEKIFVEKVWSKQDFEDFEFNLKFEETYYWDEILKWEFTKSTIKLKSLPDGKLNLDDIVTAAKFSQISALLWMLAFNYPLTENDKEIRDSNELIYFLALYMKAALDPNDEHEMVEKYIGMMNFYDHERVQKGIDEKNNKYKDLNTKIKKHSEKLRNPKVTNDLRCFRLIIKDIISAKSPTLNLITDSHSAGLFDQIQARFDQIQKNPKLSSISERTEKIVEPPEEFEF